MLRVTGLARGELVLLHRGLRRERVRERLGLIQLEGHERELLFADLDLEREGVGLRLRVGLLRGEVGDAGVRGVHRRLVLVRRGLVALGVGARVLRGALELFLTAERVPQWVVGPRGLLLADDQRKGGQRDECRADAALPPTPTSPADPGSSHGPRMVPSRPPGGQAFSHFARCALTESPAPPAPTRSATPKTVPTS